MVPKVSVIIPSYNEGQNLILAVESVLAQQWPNLEVIVVDDGSTLPAAAILEQHLPQINVIRQENQGRSTARNRGIQNSSGDYIAFLDADDIWYPGKLNIQIDALERNQNAGWSYCRTRLVCPDHGRFSSSFWPEVYGSGRPGESWIFSDLLVGRTAISTSTVVIRRSLLNRVGGFDVTLRTGEDTNLWIRLAYNSPIFYISEILATRMVDENFPFNHRHVAYESSRYGIEARCRALEAVGYESSTELYISVKANAMFESALIEFCAGDVLTGNRLWQEAKELYPSIIMTSSLSHKIGQFCLSSARYHPQGPAYAEEILDTISPNLPLEKNYKNRVVRLARAELYAACAHLYYQKDRKQDAKTYSRRALLCNPGYLSNRGHLRLAIGV
jgi:glycosyltransferase involved in cell wall biosynthesis